MIGVSGIMGLIHDLHEERMAITAALALAAGNDAESSLARMREVRAALSGDDPKGRISRLNRRTRQIVDTCVCDLEQLAARAEGGEDRG